MDNRFQKQAEGFSIQTETHYGQPLKHSSWLLVQLEHLLRKLPDNERQSCLQEVEEHLVCCRLALEEMGLDPTESDEEAVRRFGDPEAFAAQALKLREPAAYGSRVITGITAGVTLLAMAWIILGIFNMVLVWPLEIVSVALVIAYSWKYRLQLAGFVKGGILGTVILSVYTGFAYVHLGDSGGYGIAPRWQVAGLKRDAERTRASTDAALRQCDAIQKLFKGGAATVQQSPFYAAGTYLAFESSHPGASETPVYKLVRVSDYDKAAGSWETYREDYRGSWERNAMDAVPESKAADHADDHLFSAAMAVQGAEAGLLVTLCALCLNLLVFAVRSLSERLITMGKRLHA